MDGIEDFTLVTDPEEFIPKPSMRQVYDLSDGSFSLRAAALRRLGKYKIVEVHNNGDLTVQVDGDLYVVTTNGKVFKQMIAT